MRENNSLANVERFNAMQKWDYKRKVAHAQEMAEAFYSWAREHGKNVHLSVGGLDSITLHYFLESMVCPKLKFWHRWQRNLLKRHRRR